MTDRAYMERALFHARRAEGATTPNPMVGAVVVDDDGVIVGQGRHVQAGAPHAEAVALEEAGGRARGATLYVTLEPCCHHGRTGPCTELVIASGVRRVVAAMVDPNPAVSGKGFEALRAHGVRVDVGLLADEAARLNRPFITRQTRHRPMVIVKAAVSLDARLAERAGARTLLTGPGANRRVQTLRASVDAIGVGSTTMLVDDPLLTARERARSRPLVRVIFDRRLRTPPKARVFSTLDAGPVIILGATASEGGPDDAARQARRRALESAGARIVTASGHLDEDLKRLTDWEISSLLLEGGAALHAAAWRAGVVDRVHLVVAPRWLGGDGPRLFDDHLVHTGTMMPVRVEPVGVDTWMEADVYGHH